MVANRSHIFTVTFSEADLSVGLQDKLTGGDASGEIPSMLIILL